MAKPKDPSTEKPTASIAGKTTLSDEVVRSIAFMAASEVEGVHSLGKTSIRDAFSRRAADIGRGVDVEVGQKEVALDIDVSIVYGYAINDVCNSLRAMVAERVEHMVGRICKEININVIGIHFPEAEETPTKRVE